MTIDTKASRLDRIMSRTDAQDLAGYKAEVERLRKGIRDFLDGNYPNPRKHRPDKCGHGIYYYDQCEQCNDDYFVKLLLTNAEGGDGDDAR